MVGQKQNPPEPSGEQIRRLLAAPAAVCLNWQQGLLTARSSLGTPWWPSPAGFGPCPSAKGLSVRPCPVRPAGSMGHWTEGLFSSEKRIYLVTQEPTCRDSQAQQDIWSTEKVLQTVEGMKKLNRGL